MKHETAEELHLKASNYASRVCNESEEHRVKIGEQPFSREHHANMWLYHYEGFKAGYKVRDNDE